MRMRASSDAQVRPRRALVGGGLSDSWNITGRRTREEEQIHPQSCRDSSHTLASCLLHTSPPSLHTSPLPPSIHLISL